MTTKDIVPFTQARANLSELAKQVKVGAGKIITRNGESYVALIDSDRLDDYHHLEREQVYLLLIEDARRGLEDVLAGRSQDADSALAALQKHRVAKATTPKLRQGVAMPAGSLSITPDPAQQE